MYTVAQIKTLLKENSIRLTKRRGQNFLVSGRQIERMMGFYNTHKNDFVLEIGPGLGALTEPLAESCRRLIAVEFDKKFFLILKDRFKDKTNVEIVSSDILKYNMQAAAAEYNGKFNVIGNLPYNITSPIISYLINNRVLVDTAFLTMQKEVAQRLISPPGVKSYGSLSCYAQFYTKIDILGFIPREAFYPVPEVESAVVKFSFLEKPSVDVKNEKLFFRIISAIFTKRRKTIINSLKQLELYGIDVEKTRKALLSSGIDLNVRGETLNLVQLAKLADNLEARNI